MATTGVTGLTPAPCGRLNIWLKFPMLTLTKENFSLKLETSSKHSHTFRLGMFMTHGTTLITLRLVIMEPLLPTPSLQPRLKNSTSLVIYTTTECTQPAANHSFLQGPSQSTKELPN
jgi:hypothetical protein